MWRRAWGVACWWRATLSDRLFWGSSRTAGTHTSSLIDLAYCINTTNHTHSRPHASTHARTHARTHANSIPPTFPLPPLLTFFPGCRLLSASNPTRRAIPRTLRTVLFKVIGALSGLAYAITRRHANRLSLSLSLSPSLSCSFEISLLLSWSRDTQSHRKTDGQSMQ